MYFGINYTPRIWALIIRKYVEFREFPKVFECYKTYFTQKISASENEAALSYHRVRGLYSLAVDFASTMDRSSSLPSKNPNFVVYINIVEDNNLVSYRNTKRS